MGLLNLKPINESQLSPRQLVCAGKSDPYVTMEFPDADEVMSATDSGKTAKTSVVEDNLDPKVRRAT